MPTVVSLFSGCGGLDLGFKEAGFDVIYAADNDAEAVEVYRRNIDERAYVRDVTTDEFHQELASIGHCDVVLGGFPCQGFSKAGPKRFDDRRNTLYLEMRRAIETLQPSVFLAENVDGLSQNFGGKYVSAIVSDFAKLGYSVTYKIVNAAAFGVPQYRRRIIFIGIKGNSHTDYSWPEPRHYVADRNGEAVIASSMPFLSNSPPSDLPTLSAITVRQAIGDLIKLGGLSDHAILEKWPKKYLHVFKAISPGQKLCNVRHSKTSVYTWHIPEAFGYVTARQVEILETIGKNRRRKIYGDIPNGNPLKLSEIEYLSSLEEIRTDEINDLLAKGYLKEIDGKYDLKGAMFCSGLFKRPLWDAPSPTVLTNFHNPRYFLHPSEDRPFSLRECARLQGFPDHFTFSADKSDKSLLSGYRLVGNAVPPLLARYFADTILNYLIIKGRKAA